MGDPAWRYSQTPVPILGFFSQGSPGFFFLPKPVRAARPGGEEVQQAALPQGRRYLERNFPFRTSAAYSAAASRIDLPHWR